MHEHHLLVTMNILDPVCSPNRHRIRQSPRAKIRHHHSSTQTTQSQCSYEKRTAATATHLSMPSDSQLGLAISGKMHTLYRTMQSLGVVFHVEFSMNKSRHKVHLACRDSFPTRSPLSMRKSICLKRNSLNNRSERMQANSWLTEYRGELREEQTLTMRDDELVWRRLGGQVAASCASPSLYNFLCRNSRSDQVVHDRLFAILSKRYC